jgi:hypothetical protein
MDLDVLRQSRFFIKLRSYLIEHPDVKTLLRRIRLLWHHIHSKKLDYVNAKRAVSLLEHVKFFSDSPNQQRVRLAKAEVTNAENFLSDVQHSLRQVIQRLVKEQLQRDPDFLPISLIDKMNSAASLTRKSEINDSETNRRSHSFLRERSKAETFEDLKQMITSSHGPIPSSGILISALFQSLKSPRHGFYSKMQHHPLSITL